MKITIYQTGRYDINNLKKRYSSFFFLYQAVIGINGDSEYLITNSTDGDISYHCSAFLILVSKVAQYEIATKLKDSLA